MSIANTGGMRRRPTHPGEMLREDFLPDYGLTVAGLADALGVSRQTVNELLRERRALSPEMALRLVPPVRQLAGVLAERAARRGPVGRGAGDQGRCRENQAAQCRLTSGSS